MMEVLTIAAGLCRRFEGLSLKPYRCPAGVPTIGYGSTTWEDGRPVSLADAPISAERAEALLAHDLARFYAATVKLCPYLVAEPPARQAAVVDFCFNLGAGRLKASTLRTRITQRNWNAAATELRKWVRAGGRVLPGLVARRDAEANLLLGAQWH